MISDAYLTKVGLQASREEGDYLKPQATTQQSASVDRVSVSRGRSLCGIDEDGFPSIDSAFRRACREARVKEEAGTFACFKAFKRALCLGLVGNRLPALPLTKQRWQRLVPGSSPCTAHGLLVVGGAATTSPPLRREEDYRVTCAVIEAVLYCTLY